MSKEMSEETVARLLIRRAEKNAAGWVVAMLIVGVVLGFFLSLKLSTNLQATSHQYFDTLITQRNQLRDQLAQVINNNKILQNRYRLVLQDLVPLKDAPQIAEIFKKHNVTFSNGNENQPEKTENADG